MNWSLIMLSNYIKLTLRTLRKQKLQSAINLLGLSIGIALCVLIVLFVRNELTVDLFHENVDRIAQLEEWRMGANGEIQGGNPNLSAPVGADAQAEVPGVVAFTRFRESDIFVRVGNNLFEETAGYTDPTFLSMFSFPLQQGNPELALSSTDGIVLTTRVAGQLFGEEDPVGRTIEVRMDKEYRPYTVTGVVENPPANSTIRFDVLLPIMPYLSEVHHEAIDSYGWSLLLTYVLLEPGTQADDVNRALETMYAKHNGDYLNVLRERYELGPDVQTAGFNARPLREVYLRRYSDASYSYILSAIAVGILLIACINFMTMAIGRSLARSREVGIRKVVGAVRTQLIGQFWGEALFMTVLSAGMGILMAFYALPWFNEISGKTLSFDLLSDWSVPLAFLAIILFTGLVSGSYPALVLSAFRPVDILKRRLHVSGSNFFTKSLVTVQFALSVTLIICMFVMQKQMHHLRERDPGFDTEHIVLVNLNGLDGPAAAKYYREQLEDRTEIAGVTTAGSALGYRGSSGYGLQWEGKRVNIDLLSVDHRFMEEMGIRLLAGRTFDPDRAADSSGVVVVNQALVHTFGLEDPIGSAVPGLPDENTPTIIGVAADFNYQSLYQDVGPLMIAIQDYWGFEALYVRLAPGSVDRAINLLRTTWMEMTADIPFSYEFLDDHMTRVYATDARWGKIVDFASGFAVLLALLGLLGLTSLSVRSRLREFGIRKALGASTGRLVRLVAQDFVWMIAVGSALAVPAAFFATRIWLDNFAFRTDVGPLIYVSAVLAVLVAALVTISAQSLRSAAAAPVELLDRE